MFEILRAGDGAWYTVASKNEILEGTRKVAIEAIQSRPSPSRGPCSARNYPPTVSTTVAQKCTRFGPQLNPDSDSPTFDFDSLTWFWFSNLILILILILQLDSDSPTWFDFDSNSPTSFWFWFWFSDSILILYHAWFWFSDSNQISHCIALIKA